MPSSPIPALRIRLRRLQGRYPEVIRHSRISRSWLSKFANGKLGKRPGYDLLERLMGALDVMEQTAGRNGRRRESARTTKERRAGKAVGRKPR